MESHTLSNCWLWAVKRYLKDGGYIAFRRSLYGWWCHSFWSQDGETWHSFKPIEPVKRLLPPPLYRGEIVEGID